MNRIPHSDIDRLRVTFDEDSLVSDAGLLVAGTLMSRLGLEQLVDETVRLGDRRGGALPGRKVLSLVASMLVGGSHIDHADRLRAGSTQRVLPFRVMAPSTLGTFLRSFTWGHVRQLDKALGETLRRVWSQMRGPDTSPVTLDVDSTICEVWGKTKAGASYGYTGQLGYHPLLAIRSDTAEIVGSRLRSGSSQKGNTHFLTEAVNRIRRAGAAGPVTVRADAGFWSYPLIGILDRLGVEWSITIPQYSQVRKAIANIGENEWESIDYPESGMAQVAETTITASSRGDHRRVRIVVRRTRLTDPDQQQLWPDWRHHTFATNTQLSPAAADRYHRAHARLELAIRDLKAHAGLSHCPSGNFYANAAWLSCATLARVPTPATTSHNIAKGLTLPSPTGWVHSSATISKLFKENNMGCVPQGMGSGFHDWCAETDTPRRSRTGPRGTGNHPAERQWSCELRLKPQPMPPKTTLRTIEKSPHSAFSTDFP